MIPAGTSRHWHVKAPDTGSPETLIVQPDHSSSPVRMRKASGDIVSADEAGTARWLTVFYVAELAEAVQRLVSLATQSQHEGGE